MPILNEHLELDFHIPQLATNATKGHDKWWCMEDEAPIDHGISHDEIHLLDMMIWLFPYDGNKVIK